MTKKRGIESPKPAPHPALADHLTYQAIALPKGPAGSSQGPGRAPAGPRGPTSVPQWRQTSAGRARDRTRGRTTLRRRVDRPLVAPGAQRGAAPSAAPGPPRSARTRSAAGARCTGAGRSRPPASRARSRAASRSRGAPVFRAIASNRLLPKAISRTASSAHFSPTRFRAAATEHGRPGSSSRMPASLHQLRNQTHSGYASASKRWVFKPTGGERVTESVTDNGLARRRRAAGRRPDRGAAAGRGQAGRGRFGAVFAIVTAGIAVVNLDLFIVNVALPSIGRSFGGADLADLSWVLNAYAIVFAALLVPAGRAADLIGRRTAFLAGHGRLRRSPPRPAPPRRTSGCSSPPASSRRQAARCSCPASLGPAARRRPAGEADRRRSGPGPRSGGAAAALGPVLGGALVAASWHWVFLVNVPVVAVAVVAGVRVLPRARPATVRRGRDRRTSARRRRCPTRSARRCSPSRSAPSPSPSSSPTTGAGRHPRCLGSDRGGGRPAGAVRPPLGPPPGPGHRAAPAAPPRVRHRHRGERGVRHRVRRDAAAGHAVVPGRLGLVGAAHRPRRRPGAAARPVLVDRRRARSPAGSAPAPSPPPAARSTPPAACSGG